MNKDILDTINKGVNIASKMVTKGVGEVTKTIKPSQETAKVLLQTGLFHNRVQTPSYGKLIPNLDYFEPQFKNKMVLGVLKNITLPQAERAFIQGGQCLLLGRDADAAVKFEECVAKDTQLTDGYFMLGCLYLSRGNYRASLENFKKAILLQQTINKTIRRYVPSFKMILSLTSNTCFTFFADLVGVNTLLALAMRAEGLRQNSLEVLDQILAVMPAHPVLLFFEACILYEVGAFAKIIERLKDVPPEGSMGFLNLLVLGRALISMGDVETAREVLKKGLDREETDPELYLDYRYNIGLCNPAGWSAGRNEEIESVLAQNPNYQDIFLRMGLAQGSTAGAPPAKAAAVSPAPAPAIPPASVAPAPPVPADAAVPSPAAPTGDRPPARSITSAPSTPHFISDDGSINVTLENDTYVIGREIGEIIMKDDASVSKQHARIFKEGNFFFIEDLGSTNGTWVNQFRISKKVNLNRGDVVSIGKTRFRFA